MTEKAREILKETSGLQHNAEARTLLYSRKKIKVVGRGTVLVVCAGSSDIPVAEEAKVTAYALGNRVDTLYDVGVAGIHRLLSNNKKLRSASVIIAVAGMEGALPSVIGGLVDRPVIAVPTSIGYGASFGGIAALLGMLNSCAPGVVVVNIDNGFGAAYAATMINRLGPKKSQKEGGPEHRIGAAVLRKSSRGDAERHAVGGSYRNVAGHRTDEAIPPYATSELLKNAGTSAESRLL